MSPGRPGPTSKGSSCRTRSDSAGRTPPWCWEPPMLEGKKIVVTGGARGIGRAIAVACAKGGATVGLNYRSSEAEARAVQAEFADRIVLLPFDVRDAAAVQSA